MEIYGEDVVCTHHGGYIEGVLVDGTAIKLEGSSLEGGGAIAIKDYFNTGENLDDSPARLMGRGVLSVSAGTVAEIKGGGMDVPIRNDANFGVTG